MIDWGSDLLHHSVVLRLFLIIAIGYVLGEIRFPGGFRLGWAAVIFAGLGVGCLDPAFVLPGDLQDVGLVLFVYCVGLEAAPGFLQSLRKDGVRLNLSVAAALTVAFVACWFAGRVSGRSSETIAGIFCASLTNTPALGAATEWILRNGGGQDSVNAMVVSYGVVYPFGLLAVLLLFQARLSRLPAVAFRTDASGALPKAQTIDIRTLRDGVPWRVREAEQRAGVVLTRGRSPEGETRLLEQDMEIPPGFQVIAVGLPANLQQCIELLGVIGGEPLESNLKGFEARRYFVSNTAVAGRPLREIGLDKVGAIVSRIRRADVDLPINDGTVLQLGDHVRVVTYPEREEAVRRFFGNSLVALSETGYFSFAVGIVLGILLGAIPIPIPGLQQPVQLGLAGGPLIAGLALGNLGRSGPFVWNPPFSIRLTLRQVGILFFLACVGVRAGAVLPSTLRSDGVFLVCLGVGVTLAAHIVLWALLSVDPGSPPDQTFGTSAGLQTQPTALAFAARRLPPAEVNLAYATVYPLATILKIILAQLLLLFG